MRIVIAEDSVLLREGLATLLNAAGHRVVACVGDAEQLLDAVRTHEPDLSIVDVRMPPTHSDEGIKAARTLRRENPDAHILVLSQIVSGREAADLISSGNGGIGYLLKDRVGNVEDFLAALETVAGGGREVIDPHVVRQLLRRRSCIEQLTPRETEVLALMAEGKTNTAIAAELVISDAAVAKHINRVFAKLGLSDNDLVHKRVQAVLTYLRR
ncbi:response regulator transcription factor [Streptosporangium saharense]|uniref:DNA-binding NarL/FixJ family response regulator n=1 Tax=Streptosporangium saharense TaxID=1706840 RepID=A0A7W7VSC1_9ACTN|nr:response regulator transcription factor [Streptosporangium saharense]MBB4920608.1 DNA-binding NarL/FixJ family response regulator [Streptosporangium saharense]